MFKKILSILLSTVLAGTITASLGSFTANAESGSIVVTLYSLGEEGISAYERYADIGELEEKIGESSVSYDFSFWAGSNLRPLITEKTGREGGDGNDVQNVAIRFEGWFIPETDGLYNFSITGDDGYRLTVDGEEIINYWKMDWDVTTTGSVELEAGVPVSFVLDYAQGHGGAFLDVKMQEPGGALTSIDGSGFFFELMEEGLYYEDLNWLIEECWNLYNENADYPEEAREIFKSAIEAAEIARDNAQTQEDIDIVYEELSNAQFEFIFSDGGLESEFNTEECEALLAKIETLLSFVSLGTEAGQSDMNSTLDFSVDMAKTLLKVMFAESQEDVDNATKELEQAFKTFILNLVPAENENGTKIFGVPMMTDAIVKMAAITDEDKTAAVKEALSELNEDYALISFIDIELQQELDLRALLIKAMEIEEEDIDEFFEELINELLSADIESNYIVSIPLSSFDGKEDGEYEIYYVDEDGNLVKMEAVIDENNCLVFETSHLSAYAIAGTVEIADESSEVASNPENPNTGVDSNISLAVILLLAGAGVTLAMRKAVK